MFSGEAYDYIGSSRAVYDILGNVFPSKSTPISLDDIGFMLDINQLDDNRNLFLHFNDSVSISCHHQNLYSLFFSLIPSLS